MFNATKLHAELEAAGIPFWGCDDSGRINYKDEATDEHRALAEQIKAAHDPTDYEAIEAEQDKQAVTLEQVATLLNRIEARQAQIATDLTALSAANTTQFKQIVGRILNAEDEELQVIARMIKALRRLV